jgi:hypothetical protein
MRPTDRGFQPEGGQPPDHRHEPDVRTHDARENGIVGQDERVSTTIKDNS